MEKGIDRNNEGKSPPEKPVGETIETEHVEDRGHDCGTDEAVPEIPGKAA